MTLTVISWLFIILGLMTAAVIASDVRRRPQHMGIMNITWPVTGLYFPVVGWWFYRVMGRPDGMPRNTHHAGEKHNGYAHHHHHAPKPKWQSVFVGVTHCGGGCVLGDSVAAPVVSVLGFSVLGSELLGHFTGEFLAAYIFGIAFQLLPMLEMGETNLLKAFVDAVKADTLSLVSFEIGMFGWMAIAFLLLLPAVPSVASPEYWFMMQIAMMAGFATAYPTNGWLISRRIKHAM